MSPTSYQLLYSAIYRVRYFLVLYHYTKKIPYVKCYFKIICVYIELYSVIMNLITTIQ